MTVRIDLENDSVMNGDHVRGHVEWISSGKEPRKIEVVCRWRIAGSGNKLTEVVETEVEENIAARSQITIPFDFPIPLQPLTYDGKQFNVVWEIAVNVDLPFAFDEQETKVFTVRARPYDEKEFDRIEYGDDDDDEDEDEEASRNT
jgi:sporulation-control protein spo0M